MNEPISGIDGIRLRSDASPASEDSRFAEVRAFGGTSRRLKVRIWFAVLVVGGLLAALLHVVHKVS